MNNLKVYNTLNSKKEKFVPITKNKVGMYVCGPTVYSNVHLGNCRTFISFDLIFRYLKHLGYKVRYVRNITDVGHLENDEDIGEDRIAKKAKSYGVSMLEATLTGGVHALQNNNMVCLAGGDKEIFDKWKEVLQDAIGEVVVLCGDIGAGAIAKVVSNMLAFTNMVAASECMMIAKRAGLDLENFFDAIRVSAGNSFAWETVVPHIFNQKYEAGFTMDLACKDMNLSYLLGQHLNVPLDLHMEVKKKMDEARVQYGDSEGCYVYPRTLEDKLDEPLSLKGWDNWGYDIKVVDGSIVVKHKNRPTSKHPQYNSKN